MVRDNKKFLRITKWGLLGSNQVLKTLPFNSKFHKIRKGLVNKNIAENRENWPLFFLICEINRKKWSKIELSCEALLLSDATENYAKISTSKIDKCYQFFEPKLMRFKAFPLKRYNNWITRKSQISGLREPEGKRIQL